LNYSIANNSLERNPHVSLKTRRQLLLTIEELGNHQVDGQFIIGLRDGSGPAISSNEIFILTLETVTYTLLFIQMTSAGSF